MSKLHELNAIGQSIWLDYIRRDLIESGELKQMIDNGLRGMTSNPAIFEKAIANSSDYDDQLRELFKQEDLDTVAVYEALAIKDIQDVADLLRPVFDDSEGVDGYISLEANPHLANEMQGTVDEIHRLREQVNRPNVMYKIPATPAGIQAIEQLISEGVNINVTLMFSMKHYEDVANAYISGLEKFAANGGDVCTVASVASFFISRVDVKLDPQVTEKGKPELAGKIGIANSKSVYQHFKQLFGDARWQKLAAKGARVQRPLWASTGTKNPDYSDVLYVETLIGAHTVNTLPPATLDAFLDHGAVANTVEDNLDDVNAQLAALEALGIDLNQVGEELQAEGVAKFNKPFDSLLATIDAQREKLIEA
ncbi:MAG: transaldolase [Anaerolineae bacterium]|nr:transaldolase [Anaerolineae bacterium]MDQ7037363.1 transaldolase [Anaerolineae bacterium]